jgi:precorrin-6B methylase 2
MFGFIAIFAMQLIASFNTDAPFVPVPDEILDEIVKNLELKPGSILHDFGCGDGRVLLRAVKNHPEISAVGVELAILPYLMAKFQTRKYRNIKIKKGNIFDTDLSPATHIFLYLYPNVINSLIRNIKEDCKPGTTILTCDFQLKNMQPVKTVDLSEISKTKDRGQNLFVYKI